MRGACIPFREFRLYRPRGTLVFSLNSVGARARGACTPSRRHRLDRSVGRSSRCIMSCGLCARGLYPSRGCHLHRLCGTSCRTLFECVGPAPPSASVSVPASRDAWFSLAPVGVRARGACTPSRGGRLYRSAGLSFRFLIRCCSRAWGLYHLPRASSIPTPRDALPAAGRVGGACTPSSEGRRHRPRGTLDAV